ncbi:hypothetical protein L484_017623 [Morus notabilis]|uniref:Uncharacterized protein n=2 Tax=Morus notabilis TaxID=981085 RepID=W9SIV6_9ROSA|nr:hypothetical protein L484_017623 [Morus notabilis]
MAAVGGDHVIDVEALTKNIEGKLSGELSMSPLCSIFKIPTILLRHNQNAYAPNAFSFGPFHHNKENLKPTERIKARYLRDLISRLIDSDPNNPNPNMDPVQTRTLMIKTLTEAINKKRKEARQYYAGPIGMEEDKFVEVLVLDGCFIVELLRKKAYEGLRDRENGQERDPIFSMSCLLQYLWHDLLLLENQIPWMVLDILYGLTTTPIDDEKPLVQLVIEFFGNIFSTSPPPIEPLLSSPHPGKHILDLLRNSLVLNSSIIHQNKTNSDTISCELEPMRSATSLEESGIKFKMCASKSILDIKFHEKQGVLEIPTLFIQETTETVFRNLISLEQCCPNYDPIITSYAVLLDNLINSKDDMEILCKSKAIYNWLNIDDATRFFNKLYIDTFVKETFYIELTHQVNEYCRYPWHKYRRVLMRDYFKHPWAFISVIAATTALILTFLQTLFPIIKP